MPLPKTTWTLQKYQRYRYKGHLRTHNKQHMENQLRREQALEKLDADLKKWVDKVLIKSAKLNMQSNSKQVNRLLERAETFLAQIDAFWVEEKNFTMENKNHPLQQLASRRIHGLKSSLHSIFLALEHLKPKNQSAQERITKLDSSVHAVYKMIDSKK